MVFFVGWIQLEADVSYYMNTMENLITLSWNQICERSRPRKFT